jgi:zinc/manganese transport system substrate-binding protein
MLHLEFASCSDRREELPPMPTRRVALLAAVVAGLSIGLVSAETPIQAVATFSILGDLVKNVGGDRVAVTTLVGPDGDVHVFSPSPGDVKKLAGAKVIFVNGLGLEGWITRLVTASASKARVVVASDGVKTRTVPARHGGGTVVDPHAWQSVANAKIYVANIRDGLIAADPSGKAVYDANAKTYLEKLDALDSEVRAAIAQIPEDRRKVITTHAAFGYFGDAYGIDFIASEGVSTGAEPAAGDLAQIIAQIRAQQISAVFLENVSDPRLMQQIARETGARIGGTLYSDALSGPAGPAASYIEMMRHNARELVDALRP